MRGEEVNQDVKRGELAQLSGLAIGKRIGDFELVRELGSGGMGVVWEALQLSLDRAVALKFLSPENLSVESLERFEREAQAGARLNHPNIVQVFGKGEAQGYHWITHELVEHGHTLAHLLERQNKEESSRAYFESTAQLFATLADGVQHAHERGVLHRDIKPSNILIAPDGTPKIGDFGVARIEGCTTLTLSGAAAGTPRYMSPEQLQYKSKVDSRSDVFAFGIMLYQALTGALPFQGDDFFQVGQSILHDTPAAPQGIDSRIPSRLATLAMQLLRKLPEERIQSMGEVASALRRGGVTRASTSIVKGQSKRPRILRSRRSMLFGTVGALAVVLWFSRHWLFDTYANRQRRDWERLSEVYAGKPPLTIEEFRTEAENNLWARLGSIEVPAFRLEEEEEFEAVESLLLEILQPLSINLRVTEEAHAAVYDEGAVFNLDLHHPIALTDLFDLLLTQTGPDVSWWVKDSSVVLGVKEQGRENVLWNHKVKDLFLLPEFGLVDFLGPRIDKLQLREDLEEDDGGGPFGGHGDADRIYEVEALETIVRDYSSRDSWEGDGVDIRLVNGLLVVSNAPEAHVAIDRVLNALRSMLWVSAGFELRQISLPVFEEQRKLGWSGGERIRSTLIADPELVFGESFDRASSVLSKLTGIDFVFSPYHRDEDYDEIQLPPGPATLEEVLDSILAGWGGNWGFAHGVILIGDMSDLPSFDWSPSLIELVIYDVRSLNRPPDAFRQGMFWRALNWLSTDNQDTSQPVNQEDPYQLDSIVGSYDNLDALIRDFIYPESWEEDDDVGLQVTKSGLLIVKNRPEVQKKIAQYLEDLHDEARENYQD